MKGRLVFNGLEEKIMNDGRAAGFMVPCGCIGSDEGQGRVGKGVWSRLAMVGLSTALVHSIPETGAQPGYPQLSIDHDGANVIVQWPNESGELLLEHKPLLAEEEPWQWVSARRISESDEMKKYEMDTSELSRFFRLRHAWSPGPWQVDRQALPKELQKGANLPSLLMHHAEPEGEGPLVWHEYDESEQRYGAGRVLPGGKYMDVLTVTDGQVYTVREASGSDDHRLMALDPGEGILASKVMPPLGALTTDGEHLYAAGANLSVLSMGLEEIASLEGIPETESELPGEPLRRKLIHDATVQNDVLYLVDDVVRPYFTFRVDISKPDEPLLMDEYEIQTVSGRLHSQWVTHDGEWIVRRTSSRHFALTSSLITLPSSSIDDVERISIKESRIRESAELSDWGRNLRLEGYETLAHLKSEPVWAFIRKNTGRTTATPEILFGVITVDSESETIHFRQSNLPDSSSPGESPTVAVYRHQDRVFAQWDDRLYVIEEGEEGPALVWAGAAPEGRLAAPMD